MPTDRSRAPSSEPWRRPRTIAAGSGVHEAAERMVSEDAGCLVVVDELGRALGMLTDRDLALRAVGRPRTLPGLRVEDVMSRPVVSIGVGEPLRHAVLRMKQRGVRRIVVLDERERPVGLVALDDLLHALGLELHDLSQEARRHRPPTDAARERLASEARDLAERLEELWPDLDPAAREELLARLSGAGCEA